MATEILSYVFCSSRQRNLVVFRSFWTHQRMAFHRGNFLCSESTSSRDFKRTVGNQELRKQAVEELRTRSFGGTPWNELSKNSRSKILAMRVKKMLRAERRKEVAQLHRVRQREPPPLPSARKQELKKLRMAGVMEAVLHSRLRVAVDCTWDDSLSSKQIIKLVTQIRHMHNLNVRAKSPARLYLTGLCEGGKMWQESYRQISNGFHGLLMSATEKAHTQLFCQDELVYLSPDSTQLLLSLDPSKVYVIGGLVDETISKGLTLKKAEEEQVATAKLPVLEYMNLKENYPNHCVLCLNQVLGILLDVNAGKGWPRALDCHIPKRKGFTLKPEFQYHVAGGQK